MWEWSFKIYCNLPMHELIVLLCAFEILTLVWINGGIIWLYKPMDNINKNVSTHIVLGYFRVRPARSFAARWYEPSVLPKSGSSWPTLSGEPPQIPGENQEKRSEFLARVPWPPEVYPYPGSWLQDPILVPGRIEWMFAIAVSFLPSDFSCHMRLNGVLQPLARGPDMPHEPLISSKELVF